MAFAALNAGIVKLIAPEHVGVATSIFLMITLLGNAIGVAMSTTIYLISDKRYEQQLAGIIFFALKITRVEEQLAEQILPPQSGSKVSEYTDFAPQTLGPLLTLQPSVYIPAAFREEFPTQQATSICPCERSTLLRFTTFLSFKGKCTNLELHHGLFAGGA